MSDLDALLTHLPEDPYPLYDVLRNKGRVLWLDGAQRWLVTGHEETLAVLRHPRMSSDRSRWDGYRPSPGYDRSAGMFTMDPPGHTRLRGLVQRAFTARVLEGLRPRVQQLVTEFLDTAEKRGRSTSSPTSPGRCRRSCSPNCSASRPRDSTATAGGRRP
ncbi:hypothetical protein NKG94_49210 [Micromonospora sp. M12]